MSELENQMKFDMELRVSEAAKLRVEDIDSKNMQTKDIT